MSLYGDKLACVHLHDNKGLKDDHTLNKYGNIDWDIVAQKIAKNNPNICLDYEILMHYRTSKDNAYNVLQETIKQAKELEEKILLLTSDENK